MLHYYLVWDLVDGAGSGSVVVNFCKFCLPVLFHFSFVSAEALYNCTYLCMYFTCNYNIHYEGFSSLYVWYNLVIIIVNKCVLLLLVLLWF